MAKESIILSEASLIIADRMPEMSSVPRNSMERQRELPGNQAREEDAGRSPERRQTQSRRLRIRQHKIQPRG